MTNQQSKIASTASNSPQQCIDFSSSPLHSHLAAATELSSLYSFLIQLCLNGSSAEEQRSIARYILAQLHGNNLEQNPAIYSFLTNPSPFLPPLSIASLGTVPAGLIQSPRKTKRTQRRASTKLIEKPAKIGTRAGTSSGRTKSTTIAIDTGDGKDGRSLSIGPPKSDLLKKKTTGKSGTRTKSNVKIGTSPPGPSSPRGVVKKKKQQGAGMFTKSKSTLSLPAASSLAANSSKRRRPGTTGNASTPHRPSTASRPSTSCNNNSFIIHHHHPSSVDHHHQHIFTEDESPNNSLIEGEMAKKKCNTEMLQRLFKAIEFTGDDSTAIVLCRLLQGFVKYCKNSVSQRRLRLCAKLDGTSHLLRTIKTRLMERQNHRHLSNAITSDLALDTIARTLLCAVGKDRKFALKIRLNGLLSVLANCVLASDLNNAQRAPINLLRLFARCLRSNRNAQLLAKDKHLAERVVFTLNAALLAIQIDSKELIVAAATIPASFSAMSESAAAGLVGPDDDELLLTTMLVNDGGALDNVGTTRMARLMECLFFLSKNKRNKTRLLDNHCSPVLKTIFEINFQRRNEHLVHQEISLIALASLRQFAKTKKGREELMSLCTLDMCERFIAELAKEEQQQKQAPHFGITENAAATPNVTSQLQESLCALCLRCLPHQPFPYRLDKFPFCFDLPKISANKEETRRASTPNVKHQRAQLKRTPQQQHRRRQSGGAEMEDDGEPSSDEDYGFWSAIGPDMASMGGDDSIMSCGGGVTGAADISLGIGYSEGDEEENLDENREESGRKPPLGSVRALEQYSRQQPAELIMNYQQLFAEFTERNSQMMDPMPAVFDEFTSANHNEPPKSSLQIQSHEQIVRRHWTFAQQRPNSVIAFAKIAYPELLDCGDQLTNSPLASFGNAEYACGIGTQPANVTVSQESMRQLIVQKMASRYRHDQKQQNGQRRIVFDLDNHLKEGTPSGASLDNDDAERMGKFADDHLHFESRFESGNLWKAVQVAPTEYELVLSPDINQQSAHFQWFHFQVGGMRRGVPYTFEIVNCLKSISMFSRGMQPILFSIAEATRHGRPGWVRAGTEISYFRNLYAVPDDGGGDTPKKEDKKGGKNDEIVATPMHRRTRSTTSKTNGNNPKAIAIDDSSTPSRANKENAEGRNFFSLRFTLQFPHDGDICYIAYHFPYTYTRLQSTLERWLSVAAAAETTFHPNSTKAATGIHFRRQVLCRTLAGVPLPLLTITNAGGPIAAKQLALITARVHPGETNSSWIMHGLIQFLLSAHPLACKARELFVFKLVPMLNPDGVINGSHRCSLAGQDLNRVWNDPSPALHPTIFHTKGLIQYAVDVLKRPPFAFVDLHGHSRKPNIFMYGNNPEESWRQTDHHHAGGKAPPQFAQLPEILDKISDSFALKDCAFSITKAKEYSARVACWRQFKLDRVYTMESSYWGFDQGPKAGSQITIADLKRMGAELVEGLVRLYEVTAMAPMVAMAKEE